LTATIGDRTDRIEITSANQKNVIWELYSDKYFDADHLTYKLEMTVNGPSFTDDPVIWQTPEDVTIPLPIGRLKYLNPLKVPIPNEPPETTATIEDYIKRSAAQVLAGTTPGA
jgi:hypothetical protein